MDTKHVSLYPMEVEKIKRAVNSNRITKIELADMLGISRMTLDARLSGAKWKKGELALLKEIVKNYP